MFSMNSKQIVTTVGIVLVLTGLIGLIGADDTVTTVQPLGSDGHSSLEVRTGNNLPASTIDYLQSSGNLQGQGSQPQSSNAGGQLQPNAGADSLPDNY